MKLTGPAAIVAGTLFTLFIASTSGLSIWAASEEGETRGVAALHVSGHQVVIAVDRVVWLCDDLGDCSGRLRDAAGRPFVFDQVSNLSSSIAGDIYVADPGRHRVDVFGSEGRFLRTIALEVQPGATFEVLPLGENLVIADTIAHRLRLVDAQGKTLRSVLVKYPNGLSRFKGKNGSGLLVAETWRAKPLAFDANLDVLPGEIDALSAMVTANHDQTAYRELLDLTTGEGDRIAVAQCRNTKADCAFFGVEAGALKSYGDMESLKPEHAELFENDQMSGEIGLTARGTLLVASTRMTQIYEFESGVPRPFGDAALAHALDEMRARRPAFSRLESIGRWGTLMSSGLLIVLLLVARQSGVLSPARAQDRLNAIWQRVVRPDLRAFLGLFGSTIGISAIAAALGARMAGQGVAIVAALATAFLSVRFVGLRFFVSQRSSKAASEAFLLQLGSEAPRPMTMRLGETIAWCAFARPAGSPVRDELFAAAEFAKESGLLEPLAPPLHLVIRTTERLLLARCSIFGAPIDDIAFLELQTDQLMVAPADLGVRAGPDSIRLRLSGGEGRAVVAGTLSWLCLACRAPMARCGHRPVGTLAAVSLGLVFPGLGHLLQGRYGPARTAMLAAIAASADALPAMIPQWSGRLPWNPSTWAPALTAFFIVAVGALVDVVAHASRLRRRRR